MAGPRTVADLRRAGLITSQEVVAAIDAYMHDPATRGRRGRHGGTSDPAVTRRPLDPVWTASHERGSDRRHRWADTQRGPVEPSPIRGCGPVNEEQRWRMIRSELILRIAEQNPHLYAKDVEAVVDTILRRIAEALADGDRVELRDFGAFCVRDRDGRRARNPQTGEEVIVPAKTHVHFKPGKAMRARLNRVPLDPEREAESRLRTS